ncbi:MAG: YceI family protein [Anaerolineae bacterium]|nr:YceI family protein [Anaerolineae bacterium]
MFKKIIIAVAVLVIIAVGAVGYFVFRPPAEASAPIEAIPLQADESIETNSEAEVEVIEPETQEAADAEVVDESQVQPEAQGEDEVDIQEEVAAETETVEENVVPEEAAAEAEPAEDVVTEPVIYEIVQSESEARFLIDEVLRGDPITVVGTTDQVAGQIAVDFNNPQASQLGVIQVNARTLATDNNFRNRAIKNAILVTDNYEYVTFTPTEITGLPESATMGETYNFQVIGDLTVTDATREVTFDVTATATDDMQLTGTASTSVLYTDFGLFIPDAPAVDTVDDVVRLEIDFVAEAVSATS